MRAERMQPESDFAARVRVSRFIFSLLLRRRLLSMSDVVVQHTHTLLVPIRQSVMWSSKEP